MSYPTCTIVFDDGTPCDRPLVCKGMCHSHWNRDRTGKVPLGRPFRTPAPPVVICELCDQPAMCRGLCSAHYQRKYVRRGAKQKMDFDAPVRRKGESDEEKVARILDAATPDENGCLIAANIGSDGYATSVKDENGKGIKSHRLVYRVKNGPIPEGEQIHHKCAVHACINPDHLAAATQRENVGEMLARLSFTRQIEALESEIARLVAENDQLKAELTAIKLGASVYVI